MSTIHHTIRRIRSFVFILALSLQEAIAGNGFIAKHMSVADGLPSNTIRAIVQDNTGYIWMGGTAGLARYDGYSFVKFDTPAKTISNVALLDYDSRDNLLWVTSPTYSISCLDLNKGLFTDYTAKGDHNKCFRKHLLTDRGMWLYNETYGIRHITRQNGSFCCTDYNTAGKSLPENDIRYMTQDAKGNMWAISLHHILIIDGNGKARIVKKGVSPRDLKAEGDDIVVLDKTGCLFHFNTAARQVAESSIPASLATTEEVTASMIWQDQYVVFTKHGTLCYHLRKGVWRKPHDMQIQGALWQGEVKGFRFMADTAHGILWIFPDKGRQQHLKLISNISANPGRGRIFNATLLDDKTLAVASYGGGLAIISETPGGEVPDYRVFTAEDSKPLFHSNYLFTIMKDSANGLWLAADAAGVSNITPAVPPAAIFAIPYPERRGSRDNGIASVVKTKTGDIIASTFNEKNYIVDSGKATLTPYTAFRHGISAYAVDNNGNEWIGTNSNGLFLNGNLVKELPSTLSICDITCDTKGRIWIATYKKGLLWTSPRHKGKFHQLLNETYNSSRTCDMELSPDGRLYVSTYDGLFAINTNSRDIRRQDIIKFSTTNGKLPTNEVTGLLADNDNTLWVGTNGYGLLRCDINGHHIKTVSVTRLNGMPNDNICAISKDDNGIIWTGTEEGLAMVDTKTMTAQAYYPAATIMGNVYNQHCALKNNDGTLLFCTNEGVAIVGGTTGYKVPGEKLPPPHLTDIRVNGKSILSDVSVLSEGNPFTERHITFDHSQNNIVFTISTLDYNRSHTTLYQYRTVGIDNDWHNPTTSNRIECPHLAPGEYTLLFRTLTNGKWSEAQTFRFTISQPWYNTPWAWLLYSLIITAVATAMYRQWRHNFELRQNMKMEKQINEFRIRFFTNIAHEFRTPLAIIQSAADSLTESPADTTLASQRPSLQMVRRGTARLLRLVNDLMEFRKISTGNIRLKLTDADIMATVRGIYDDFRTLAKQKEQNLVFIPFGKSFIMPFDRQKIETIVYNLLSNAVKYTPNKGSITLYVKHNEGNVTISVSDNGPGLNEQQRQRLFTPFSGGYANKGGMGIGLYTAHQLATLHKGTLNYTHDQQGTTFTLTLPDNKQPYTADDYDTDRAIEQQDNTKQLTDEIILEPEAQAMNDADIAIIEDDADMLLQLKNTLAPFFRVTTYDNGTSALQGITHAKPELVICDVMLPDTDGYQIVKSLKKDKAFYDTPVIMLTALDSNEHRIKGYKAGADDYLVKPCDKKLLITRTVQLITWARRRKNEKNATDAQHNTDNIPVVSMADRNFRNDVDYFISAHIAEPSFNVETLASLMQMGHTKFYGKMKELTGMSPNKYIMEQRMRIAQQMVLEGRLNISEIAYKTGFQDPSYFNKCFKKHFGTIPSKYGK